MSDSAEIVRAQLDLADSTAVARKLNDEIDRLEKGLKTVTSNYAAGKIPVEDYLKASGNLREKIAGFSSELNLLKKPLEDVGGQGAGIDRMVGNLFKLERGLSMLAADRGLPRAAGLLESAIGFAGGPAGIGIAIGLIANSVENVAPKIKAAWDAMWHSLTPGGQAAVTAAKERFKELKSELEGYTDATNKFVAAQRSKNEVLEREVALQKALVEQRDKRQKEALAGIAAAHPVAPGEGEAGEEAAMKERGKRLAAIMTREQKETMESEVASYQTMKDPEMGRLKDQERKLLARMQRAQELGDPSQVEQARQALIANRKAQADRRLQIQTTAAQWRGQAETGTLTTEDWGALSRMTSPETQARMREAAVLPADVTGLGTAAGLAARRKRQAQMLALYHGAAAMHGAMASAGTAAAAPGHTAGTVEQMARQYREDLAGAKSDRERAALTAQYQERLGMRGLSTTDFVNNPPSAVSQRPRTRESQARADAIKIRDLSRQVRHLEGLIGQQMNIQSHGMDLQDTTQGMIATYSAQIQALRRQLAQLQAHQRAQRRDADQTAQQAGGP